MVNQNQDADEVVHRLRQDNVMVENNLNTMTERIMPQNGLITFCKQSYQGVVKSLSSQNSQKTLVNPLSNM